MGALEKGLRQRGAGVEYVLYDVYHEQNIIKAD